MAERSKSQTKRAPAKRTPARKSAGTNATALANAIERLEAKMGKLQRERDDLRTKLNAVNARVKELEIANTNAVDRIDWVIDSLHNLLEGED